MEAYRKAVAQEQEPSSLLTTPIKEKELKEKPMCLSAQNMQESTTSSSSPVKSNERNDLCATSLHDESTADLILEEVKESEVVAGEQALAPSASPEK